MKKMSDFKENQFDCSNTFGSSGNLITTPGGTVLGMTYTYDTFVDADRDGRWTNETLTLHNDCRSELHHGVA